MRQLLIIFFCGFTGMVYAQSGSSATGTNADSNAPVNVSAPGLRPAQPAMHQSVPVQNRGQFYIVNDKPATPQGQIISGTPVMRRTKDSAIKAAREAAAANKSAATEQKTTGKATGAASKNNSGTTGQERANNAAPDAKSTVGKPAKNSGSR